MSEISKYLHFLQLTKKIKSNSIGRYILITLGVIIGSFFNSRFISANGLAPGGLIGIGVILKNLFPSIDPGIFGLICSVPLFIIAWLILGKQFVFNTIYASVLFNILVWFFNKFVLYKPNDLLLSALIGGIGCGIGASIIFTNNTTAGGSDIVARLIQKKFTHLKIGSIILIIDSLVMICLMLVKRNMDIGYISIIASISSAFVIDTMVEGFNLTKIIYINTKAQNYPKIKESIIINNISSKIIPMLLTNKGMIMIMFITNGDKIQEINKMISKIDNSASIISCVTQEY